MYIVCIYVPSRILFSFRSWYILISFIREEDRSGYARVRVCWWLAVYVLWYFVWLHWAWPCYMLDAGLGPWRCLTVQLDVRPYSCALHLHFAHLRFVAYKNEFALKRNHIKLPKYRNDLLNVLSQNSLLLILLESLCLPYWWNTYYVPVNM